MIRSNFEFDFSQSSSRKIFDQFDKIVNDILDELNERMRDQKKEIYVFKVKRRQSVFIFDNDVRINDDDAAFSLNVVNIKQLQWWAQNHSHIFLFDFSTLRIDRNRFLKTLNDYHDLAKEFKIQSNRLTNIETIYDEMKNKLKIVELKAITIEIQNINNIKKIDDKRIEIIDLNTQLIELEKKYVDLIINEERDDDDLSIVNFSKKKRIFKHFESLTFIDEVNFDWRIWKFKIHDKMTINHDHYDIALFEITVVINWIDDEIEKHIQAMRDLDINHFKSHEMMMKYFEIIFSNFDYKRKIRIEFRALIISTQSFQKFFSNFLRLSVATEYSENTKLEKLHEKLSIKLKNVLSNNSREFFTLIEIRIELSKIYNNQKKIRKQRVEKKIARLSRSEYTQSKFTSAILTSVSFVKLITSILFVKFTIRFQLNVEHKHDSVIDKLIVTSKCFTCDESNQIWKKCLNVNKYQKRHWHKLQITHMNLNIDSSDFDSKNW